MSRTIEDLRTESQQDDPAKEQKNQKVINALALGWSLVELLGRCFTLKLPTPEKEKEVSPELQRQADVWYDLLTAQCDPTTYVTPSHVTWRYTLKVIRFSLPYIIVGIILAAVITLLIAFLIGHFWPPIAEILKASTTVISTTTAMGTGFSLLAGIGTAIPTFNHVVHQITQSQIVLKRVDSQTAVATSPNTHGKELTHV
jgi:sensor histidine kinase YesM